MVLYEYGSTESIRTVLGYTDYVRLLGLADI